MAERDPHPADDHDSDNVDDTSQPLNADENTSSNSNCFGRTTGHATYVVQVPKDQIYRVPPPENAAIAERHRNPAKNDNNKKNITLCASHCCCVLLLVTVLVLALGLAAAILSVYLRPKNPGFYVEHVDLVFHNSTDHHRSRNSQACNVRLRSENTNAEVDVSYREGGVVSLWFGQHEIGFGEFPAFYHARGNSTTFNVVLLRGKPDDGDRLKKEMEKSSEIDHKQRTGHVELSLKMENITARTDHVGTWITGTLKLGVACDVTVDSLSKGSRVLSQECRTTHED